jgi:hypothetical protein
MAETHGLWRKLLHGLRELEHVLGRIHLLAWLAGGSALINGVILIWQFLRRGDVSWARGAAIGLGLSLLLLALYAIVYYVKRRKSIEAAVEAALWLLKIGRWVYGPRTEEGRGRVGLEVGDAWTKFDRAVTMYRGPDAEDLRKLSDEIRKASLPSRDIGAQLIPLLDKLAIWIEWAEKELLHIKRHPLDKRP